MSGYRSSVNLLGVVSTDVMKSP